MAIAINDTDARQATVRHWFAVHLLRQPNNQQELDMHVWKIATEGANAALAGILDSAEGKAVMAKKRTSIGI